MRLLPRAFANEERESPLVGLEGLIGLCFALGLGG